MLQHPVQRVEEGVERRVDGQHEDGHGHADLARHRHVLGGQQTQQANGEPAEEVGHGHGDEAAGDAGVYRLLAALRGGHPVGPDGDVDEGLPGGDQHEEDEVDDDNDGEGVVLAGEVVAPGDGQRDADAGLAVEAPVGGPWEQRGGGQRHPREPDKQTRPAGRGLVEPNGAEGEAKHEESVEGDEADEEGGHLTGQQREEAGRLAERAVSPGRVRQHVAAPVQPVRHPHHSQVQPHQKVGQTQMGHENGEPRFVGRPVDEDAGHEAAEVAEQREDREDGQKDPVDVRPQQSIAGRQLVERREAVAEGKVVGQRGRAAELVVVSEERLQLVQSFKHVAGEGGHGATSQVQHSELGQTPEVVRLLHVTSGQVQHVQAGEGLEDRGAQLEYSDLGQVQVTQGPKGRRGRSRVIVEQGREGVSRQNQRP